MFKFLGLKSLANIRYLPKFFFDTKISFYEKLESLIYIVLIVSPIDIIPEYILGVGVIDDAIILVIFMNRILTNLDKYKNETMKNEDNEIEVKYTIKNDENDENDEND
ncbi:DUF1232 domain-containing protein [Clostridiaceae bacterium HSG29]|nr:DUF1232 domain-containing protein [Clostridiaceae bacterium HSG29]